MASPDSPAPGVRSTLRLRRMVPADSAAAAALEDSAFTPGWPRTAFDRELSRNPAARYIVIERLDAGAATIIGFAGLWLQLDEAHVVTVGVSPDERGKGYGRVLLHALIDVARRHDMSVGTLECGVTNTPARNLYRSYGFWEVGLRKKYYRHSGEDALIMTTEEFDSEPFKRLYAEREAELRERFPGLSLHLGD